MTEHNHNVPPRGTPVKMHVMQCDHGEPFVCVADLVLWLDRMSIDPIAFPKKNQFRNYVIDNLTQLSVDFLLDEDGLT